MSFITQLFLSRETVCFACIFFTVSCIFFFLGFGVKVLKVSPMLMTTASVCLVLVVLVIIVVVRLKSANSRKRNSRQPIGGDKQVIVHHRSNGQVATTILETETDPDLIQVKYGKNHSYCFVLIDFFFCIHNIRMFSQVFQEYPTTTI